MIETQEHHNECHWHSDWHACNCGAFDIKTVISNGEIPFNQKPPISQVRNSISKDVYEATKPLVRIIQNDNACNTVLFDSVPEQEALIIDSGELKLVSGNNSIVVPIHNTKPEPDQIDTLLKGACELSSEKSLLDSDLCSKLIIHENDEYKFLAPEPEHFGCFIVNLKGWGAFCFPSYIFRRKKS